MPSTSRRAIPAVTGNHKFLLEPSRLQHVTLLAAAYYLTGREAFAALAAAQLHSWWRANPFLTGIHWSSGIEVALRLVSFAWARRLLAGWTGVGDCFEESDLARDQIFRHLQYLARLRSHGSSANNHLLAELLGLYVGASAFPWFAHCRAWRLAAERELEAEATRQVFPDGLSREQASDYHGFVLEMLMTAAAEGMLAGRPFSPGFHGVIARMADAWAAMLDCRGRPPRQGDTDDAFAVLLDPRTGSAGPHRSSPPPAAWSARAAGGRQPRRIFAAASSAPSPKAAIRLSPVIEARPAERPASLSRGRPRSPARYRAA